MSFRVLSSCLAAASAAVLPLAPVGALADGAYHPATSAEAGTTYHPGHASNTSSEQVAADLEKAQKSPAWNSASRGGAWPVPKTEAPKTREQVNAELNTAMKDPAWGSASRGAPWPSRK